ncbi:MAG: HAD hydrolase family protein [Chloroflexi bacterium]|nr:HAD hydrolase family protein [Chloroflexota bacterium]
MRYRLVMVDVDGTLVGAGGRVSSVVAAALRATEAAGVRVALCTGRTIAACRDYLDDLGLSGPHTFFDGSLIVDPVTSATVLAARIDPAAAAEVVAFGAEQGLSVELYTHDGYYVAALAPETADHAALQGVTPMVTDLPALLAGGDVIKAEFVLSDEAGVVAVRGLASRLSGRLRFSWATAPGLPHLTFVNVVDPRVSKGVALRATADHLAIPLAEVIAIGDGHNDVAMFDVAGLSIAMAGAPPAVRAAAQVATGAVEDDGLAMALSHHILG